MLDIKLIRENPEKINELLKEYTKGKDAEKLRIVVKK